VNSGRALENEVRGQQGENEVRGGANENEVRGRVAENEIEIEIENEIRRENENRNNEIEIHGEGGLRTKVRLQAEDAISHRSTVAQSVMELLSASRNLQTGEDRGIGDRVRLIAKAQNDSRKKVAASLEQIEAKNGVAEFLFGPDFGEIENVKNEIGANDKRVNQLTEAEAEIGDVAVKNQVDQQLQVLQKENENLKAEVEKAENVTSLFGWAVRMFQ
jgi:hypothetical protein